MRGSVDGTSAGPLPRSICLKKSPSFAILTGPHLSLSLSHSLIKSSARLTAAATSFYAACRIKLKARIPNIGHRMTRLCMNISHISESEPFSTVSDFDMLSSPININARSRGQRIVEEDDDIASIITLSVDEVLGDGEKSGHCLVRMECLSASTGSNYSPYYDEEPRHQSPRDMQVPRDTPDWALLKKSIDYPESVGWDSNSETQCSRSEIHASGSGVAYVKIALSSEIKSSTQEVLPHQVRLRFYPHSPLCSHTSFHVAIRLLPKQILYHSPTLSTEADLDSCDAPALDSVMLRRAETLQEVSMVEYLNSEDLRRDPWNPAAPLLAVVNANDPDDDAAILILERLQPYDAVPCKTVRDVVDLTRQLLQVCRGRKHDMGANSQDI